MGRVLRQPTVRDAAGSECRLDELLGRGFAVVDRKQSDLRLGDPANAVLERLGGRCLCLEELEVIEGAVDSLFDCYPAVVLRPDRYIFGVVDDHWSLDRLIAELVRKRFLELGS